MKNKYLMVSLALLLVVGSLIACSKTTTEQPSTTSSPLNEDGTINWEKRIEANKAVGEITYMTGYYYAASPPDIQVVLAEKLGYFDELGLDVAIQPGLDAEGMKFLATDKAQIASAGSPSIVLQAISNGAAIQGIATFGHVGTSAIMVLDDSSIQTPADLVGKTLAYHGAIPANMLAMFAKNNINVTDIKGVNIGYDLSVFINSAEKGEIDALTVYKSNEPYTMEKLGYKVRLIDPGQFGAETSFGVLAANQKFAESNPETVQDFLRAVAKAHDYAVANPEASIDVLASLSDTVYDVDAELNRWRVEMDLLESEKVADKVVGYQTDEQWQREIDMLVEAGVIPNQLDVTKTMTNRYIEGITDNNTLIWPTGTVQ